MDDRLAEAGEQDAADELAAFRDAFELPSDSDGEPLRYLCGHSLGLMPRGARRLVERELDRWSRRAVDGHFDRSGWYRYHERLAPPLARLLGAEPAEIVAMNSLTVNLHLMLASFFRPERDRRRILIEKHAFPSDRFAVQSQLGFHGLDPDADCIELEPGPDQTTGEALAAALERQGGRIALILLPGVQYLSGEAIDLADCADAARRHGCRIGFDLAHAIGNLPVDLRASEPDFAVWCSYKYLNAGPGAIGGCFVNRRWIGDVSLPRLAGWWGHDPESRFDADVAFAPVASADGWQLSNPPVFSMAPLEASLDLFMQAGIDRLRAKSLALTELLEAAIVESCGDRVTVLTPRETSARGAQLSIRLEHVPSEPVIAAIRAAGVIADWREPNVLRMAPAPLYNSFADAYAGAAALADALDG